MVLGAVELHAAASWALLLFLAATQRVDAISSTVDSTTSSTESCSRACFEDTVCYECLTELDDEAQDKCAENFEYDETSTVCHWIYVSRACCQDYASPNDCMGNSVFVEYNLCIINEYSFLDEGEECTTLTCSFGSADKAIGDSLADDDTDTGIVDDDAGGTEDATGLVEDATSAADDDTEGTDDVTGVVDDATGLVDDATSAVDDDAEGTDGATNGTHRVEFSCPSAMLTLVLGLAILAAGPLLTASL